jgi:hypothetical protein
MAKSIHFHLTSELSCRQEAKRSAGGLAVSLSGLFGLPVLSGHCYLMLYFQWFNTP